MNVFRAQQGSVSGSEYGDEHFGSSGDSGSEDNEDSEGEQLEGAVGGQPADRFAPRKIKTAPVGPRWAATSRGRSGRPLRELISSRPKFPALQS